ncbi:hypothetical protein [Flavobacterium sp.]|uniref:hypothetical protein n=1 Tax=Flavobacterium sp. TaxID=239 RepID=UPI0026065F8C|nr:hypothetical protein [Flavobacterium sp.]MDD2985116.1 hypothetical protein [Flavobacterium sp.]
MDYKRNINKILSFFSLILLLGSCNYFDKHVPSEADLLEQRLKEIDWNEVTVYPCVASCDSILDKEQKKACFFTFMTTLIQQKISIDSLPQQARIIDTIQVRVKVSATSEITFEPLFKTDSLPYSKTKIDSLIQTRLTNFPKIEPAQKEGIPVKTEFILPVIIKLE